MSDLQPQQLGKFLLITGVIISAIGILIMLLGKTGLFKLPGDIEMEGKNWKIYFPLASCIIISIILTAVFWIISYFRK